MPSPLISFSAAWVAAPETRAVGVDLVDGAVGQVLEGDELRAQGQRPLLLSRALQDAEVVAAQLVSTTT